MTFEEDGTEFRSKATKVFGYPVHLAHPKPSPTALHGLLPAFIRGTGTLGVGKRESGSEASLWGKWKAFPN